jgi:hypothetical protein
MDDYTFVGEVVIKVEPLGIVQLEVFEKAGIDFLTCRRPSTTLSNKQHLIRYYRFQEEF